MTRTFKVMEPMMGLTGSELRFRGTWLKAAGFPPGATVTLTNPEPGVLALRVNPPSAPLTNDDFKAAIEPLRRLGL